MALDDLAATIETIKQRILDHRSSLAANETRTRQVLIDPLLGALGWDVSDPNQIELEYDVRGRRADYALLVNTNPIAVIEAKRLGHQLVDDNTMQVMNYANTAGIEYMVVTNGDEWKMYSVFERGAIEERVIMELRIANLPAHLNALKSLSLWRENLGSEGDPVKANAPVLGNLIRDTRSHVAINQSSVESNELERQPAKLRKPNIRPKVGLTPIRPSTGRGGTSNGIGEWRSVGDLSFNPTGKRAVRVRLIDREVESRNFSQIAVEIASWVINNGWLTEDRCPIRARPTGSTYLIALRPVHEDGRVFRSAKELPNGLVMEVAASSSDLLTFIRNLLESCGVDSDSVGIKWEGRS